MLTRPLHVMAFPVVVTATWLQVVEGRDEIDLRRHGMFCAFGLFYLVSFQYLCICDVDPAIQVLSKAAAGRPDVAVRCRVVSLDDHLSKAVNPVEHGLMTLQGGFQYYLYNHLFSRWCKTITATVGHRGSAPVKTFIDQFIQ